MKAPVSRLTFWITTGVLLLALLVTWDVLFAMNRASEKREEALSARITTLNTLVAAVAETAQADAFLGATNSQLRDRMLGVIETHQARIEKAETQLELQAMDIAITSNRLAAAITRLATPTATARR